MKVRNPHGYRGKEWTGKWSDTDSSWYNVPDRHRYQTSSSDGSFWMDASDFLTIFELATVCLLPRTWDSTKHQIDIQGNFIDDVNTPADGAIEDETLKRNKNFQFLLHVDAVDVELWAQVVLYMTNAKFYDERQISFNIYQGIQPLGGTISLGTSQLSALRSSKQTQEIIYTFY